MDYPSIRLGKDLDGGGDVVADRLWGDIGGTVAVLGGSGSGKSAAVKTIVHRMLGHGVPVLVVDSSPVPEYGALAAAHGVAEFGPAADGERPYNLLDGSLYPAAERVAMLVSVIAALGDGNDTDDHMSAIDCVLGMALRDGGGRTDMGGWLRVADTNGRATMEDLAASEIPKEGSLLNPRDREGVRASILAAMSELADRVRAYVRDGGFSFLPSEADLMSGEPLRVFHIPSDDKEALAAVQALSSYAKEASDGRTPQAIVVDDAWRYLARMDTPGLMHLSRSARPKAISLWFVGQGTEDIPIRVRHDAVMALRPAGSVAAETAAWAGVAEHEVKGLGPREFFYVVPELDLDAVWVGLDQSPEEIEVSSSAG